MLKTVCVHLTVLCSSDTFLSRAADSHARGLHEVLTFLVLRRCKRKLTTLSFLFPFLPPSNPQTAHSGSIKTTSHLTGLVWHLWMDYRQSVDALESVVSLINLINKIVIICERIFSQIHKESGACLVSAIITSDVRRMTKNSVSSSRGYYELTHRL